MRRVQDKNLKALIITLILISVMSVLSPEQNSIVSGGLNAATKGLFQVSAHAAASADSANEEDVRRELERLKSENAELRNQLSDYIDTKQENARLKKLLDIKKDNPSYKLTPANVIKRDANDDFYSFTLDEGTAQGISVNNPVITENGLVGWVCQADAANCKVKTILSPDKKAGAKDKQSGDNGIINGSATLCDQNLTAMTTLAENHKVKKGDMVVTSGTGGVYPGGLLIGEVQSVEFNSYDASRHAVVKWTAMKSNNRAFFKYFAFSLEVILLAVLQSTPKLLPELFGAKPFLLFALALSVAAFEDFIPSIIFAAVCGAVSDLNSAGNIGYFAITLTLICAAVHYFTRTYLNATLFTFVITSAVSIFAVMLFYFIIFRAFSSGADAWALFGSHYVPRMILTLLSAIILYVINGFIHRSFTGKTGF